MDLETVDLEKLSGDIRFIRQSLSKNMKVLREINFSSPVKYSSLLFGISMIVLPVGMFYFIIRYGSFKAVPTVITGSVFLLTVLALFISYLVKFRIYNPLKKIYNDKSTFRVILNLMGRQMLYFYTISALVFFVLSFYLLFFSMPQYIICVFSVMFGLFLAVIGFSSEIPEFSFLGFWLLITGLAGIPFIKVCPRLALIVVAVSTGVGCVFYFLTTHFRLFSGKGMTDGR